MNIYLFFRPPATFLKKKKRKRHDSSESDPELKHAVGETEEMDDDSIQVSKTQQNVLQCYRYFCHPL